MHGIDSSNPMPPTEPTRNLLILQDTALQDPADWIAVKQRIDRDAPDIEVRIANNRNSNSVTRRWQVRRPSLVFSPGALITYEPRGGAIFCGRIHGKDEQLRRLSAAGIPTPKTARLAAESSFDPKDWGDYLIVKPNTLNSGKGVKLVRTAELSPRHAEPSIAASDRILVQPYIDHAEDGYPTEYRVLTLFGRALYCSRNRWGEKRGPLAAIAADPQGEIASNSKAMGGRVRMVCNDPEIVALGERAHAAFPACAVLGVDIIRDRDSGRLYVLEVNSHGVVWHLSSPLAKTFDPQHVRDLYAQFNALDRIAELLIQKTRAVAC